VFNYKAMLEDLKGKSNKKRKGLKKFLKACEKVSSGNKMIRFEEL